ncbi:MAG TPA: serine/threonine-protein kinase, partial [Planctomycetaceae bacterium]|nr:serine/threonine-protein kinase [Planctomycetaceae bacterium]
GGFGEVYYALTDAGKEVALKLLKQHFDVELRGVSQCLNLKHPNLVTIFDIKHDADGDHWVIMEYVAGKSLSQVLDGYPDGMPIDDVRKWLSGLVDGLSFLHDRGIVHRDLKPGNVFIENGAVKIGDVGLSKFISESHRSAQTQSVGTVYYMAPEVAHGRYGREVDVYSLGIVLYELLTGRVPFIGESAGEILMKHLSEKPDLSPIPRRLRPVLASALEKDPLRRTPNVRQLADDFNKAVAGFDVPQEIPEESFLNATQADSSTLERERPVSPPPPRGRSTPPNLKDIIAGDVARAMEVAEKAARRAKEMADEAYRASRGHRRHSSRIERKMARWNRSQKHCRDNYATFWGWRGCQKRTSQPSPANVSQAGPPMDSRAGRCGPKASRGWVKPALIALVILAFIPGPRAFGMQHAHGGVVPLAVLAVIIFVAYRALSSRPSRESFAPGSAGQAAAGRPQVSVPPVAPNVRPVEIPRTVPPPPVVKVRRSVVLSPDTPRLIPVRQRMSELALSLTYAAISTALITSGLAFVTGLFSDKAQIAEFAGTLLAASWLVLAQSKLWEGRTYDVGMRRVSLVLTGAAIGSLSYWLHRMLIIDLPTADSIKGLVHRIGTHSLIEPGTTNQPSMAGYVVFFACLMGLHRWWRQADSFRSGRLAIWSIVPTAVVALVLTAIFSFPTVWGTVWAAAISATVQLSAAWVPPRDRAAFMEAANHG